MIILIIWQVFFSVTLKGTCKVNGITLTDFFVLSVYPARKLLSHR